MRPAANSRLAELPFHPSLFAVLPTLLILSQNGLEIGPIAALRPLAISLAVALGLQAALSSALKDVRWAGLLTTLTVGLFAAYGRLYTGNVHGLLRGAVESAGLPGNHSRTAAAVLALWVAAGWATYRLRVLSRPITVLLNVASFSLVVGSLFTIGRFEWRIGRPWLPDSGLPQSPRQVERDNPGDLSAPDIYYVVLDGYGRQDVLSELYDLDNGPFLDFLTANGFFVVEGAHSNYDQTTLSLASTLSLDYLDAGTLLGGARAGDRTPLVRMIRHSPLQSALEAQGYAFVTLPGGYRPTELSGARALPTAGGESTLLERLLIENSALALVDQLPALPDSLVHPAYPRHRRRVLEQFARLPTAGDDSGPQFVYAHILIPHPPFVFDRDGTPRQPDYPYVLLDGSAFPGDRRQYRQHYRDQLLFANQQLEASLAALLAEHGDRAWIVIQGDHGPGSQLDWNRMAGTNLRERFGILLAYRPPGGGHSPASFQSPVNLFRAVLRAAFELPLPFLEDRAYYSTWDRPYEFQRVPAEQLRPLPAPEDG